jgi:DNA polymerase III epsilon subunit-like protein
MSEILAAPSELPIVVLDFEASAMPSRSSYPIEVGIAFVLSGESRSWLIRPTEQWLQTGQWDPESEKIHRLTKEVLLAEGQPVDRVRSELTEAVAGHRVLSDALMADALWLRSLYGGTPAFRLGSVGAVLEALTAPLGSGGRGPLAKAVKLASRRFPQAHRAGPDARRLAEVIRILMRLS